MTESSVMCPFMSDFYAGCRDMNSTDHDVVIEFTINSRACMSALGRKQALFTIQIIKYLS